MQLEIGKIYEGKVKGITQYGAFVDIDGGGTGMVHISEIANTFVNEIRDHLTENQQVKVKVIGINEAGKVSLSIKKPSITLLLNALLLKDLVSLAVTTDLVVQSGNQKNNSL